MPACLTIGQLARAAAVPVSTLRYYERIGVLTPQSRSASGYRQYGAAELQRLRLVRLAQNVGFSLDDAALLLQLREHAPVPKAQVDELVRRRLARVDEQLAQLREIQCVLRAAQECCADGCACPRCSDLALLQQEIGSELRPTA